jgi:hypothetical protein
MQPATCGGFWPPVVAVRAVFGTRVAPRSHLGISCAGATSARAPRTCDAPRWARVRHVGGVAHARRTDRPAVAKATPALGRDRWFRRASRSCPERELDPAGADCGDDATVDQHVAAGDEAAVVPEKEGRGSGDLVRGSCASRGGLLDHRLVASCAGTGHFVECERRDDDAGADRVDAGAAIGPIRRRLPGRAGGSRALRSRMRRRSSARPRG